MTIPVSQIAQVNPGVLAAAGNALDLNGLLLSKNANLSNGVQRFASVADVQAFFGVGTDEANFAGVYFNGPDNSPMTPGALLIGRYNDAASSAFLRSANLGTMTLTQLKALSGVLTITVDGVVKTSAAINLSGATSFANAATLILAGFTSPGFTVTYSSQLNAFVFTDSSTGASSVLSYASGTLAAPLYLTQATGAVLSAGAVADTPAIAMARILAASTDWATFTTIWEPVLADKTSFGAWTAQQGNRYAYVGYDSDPTAKVSGSTASWGYSVLANDTDGALPVFGDYTHAALIMSWAAALNFTLLNGRSTLAFQTQGGLLPSCTNATDAANLIANGYNFYGAYGTARQGFNFIYPGSIGGDYDWADSYITQIWLTAQLQLALITLLTSAGSIPYNAAGNAMIEAAIQDPVQAAVNFGAIRLNVPLSNSQLSQLRNAIGADVSQTIAAQGYYLKIGEASPATRVARGSPPMTLWYTDGGSVQKLILQSIEIQ